MTSPLAVIETDAFCERCGFNLRSRPVTRDERLGVLICQCPECGSYQSATGRATAMTPWLQRLALLAAIVWVGLGLTFAVAFFFGSFGLQASAVEGLTNQTLMASDGTAVTYNFGASGPKVVRVTDHEQEVAKDERLTQRRELVPSLGGPTRESTNNWSFHDVTPSGVAIVFLAEALAVYAAGAILAAGCWFWRPRLRYLWLVVPVLASILTLSVTRRDGLGPYIESLGYDVTYDQKFVMSLILAAVVAEIAVLALGLATGRTFVRGILTVFSPPGVRQLFAFLWHCDGKTMPPARAAMAQG